MKLAERGIWGGSAKYFPLDWNRWFAWHPVTVESMDLNRVSLVWLEYVERKPTHGYNGYSWRYRECLN